MTNEEKLNKIVDHIWSVYLPVVLAALRDTCPRSREAFARVKKDDIRSYLETRKSEFLLYRMNSIDFVLWHSLSNRVQYELPTQECDKAVREYIEMWFNCPYQELMFPKDI